jgi:hypothetical protein
VGPRHPSRAQGLSGLKRALRLAFFPRNLQAEGSGQTDPILHPAKACDLPAFLVLYRDLVPDDALISRALAGDIFDKLRSYEGSAIFVAVLGGEMAASCTVSDIHAPLIFAFRAVVRSSSGGFERLRAHRGVPDVLIVMPFCACA